MLPPYRFEFTTLVPLSWFTDEMLLAMNKRQLSVVIEGAISTVSMWPDDEIEQIPLVPEPVQRGDGLCEFRDEYELVYGVRVMRAKIASN